MLCETRQDALFICVHVQVAAVGISRDFRVKLRNDQLAWLQSHKDTTCCYELALGEAVCKMLAIPFQDFSYALQYLADGADSVLLMGKTVEHEESLTACTVDLTQTMFHLH